MTRCVLTFSLVLVTLLQLGCSRKNEGPRRFAVSGKVTIGGQPAELGSITFRPGPENHGPVAGAEIKAGTFEIDAAQGPGSGVYSVVLEIEAVNEVEAHQSMLEVLPEGKGGTIKKFEYERTISADGEKVFDFDLPSAPQQPDDE